MNAELRSARSATEGGAHDVAVLPRLVLLTDRRQAARPLPAVVEEAVAAGVRAIVLRERDLPRSDREDLVAQLSPILHDAGGLLLTAGERLGGADGVHLPASSAVHQVPPGDGERRGITGRSCHSEAELRAAAAEGVDYVTVSPVFASTSKPGYGPALGPSGLAQLVATTSVPVYALGGVEDAHRVAACRRAGAHGVAVMGAVMRSPDPARLVSELVSAAEEAP